MSGNNIELNDGDSGNEAYDSQDDAEAGFESDQHFTLQEVPLWLTAALDDVSDVLQLLRSGIINVEHGHQGSTPLMNATAEGRLEIVKVLVARGADPFFFKVSTGDTPLIMAAAYGRTDTVMYLLGLREQKINTQNMAGFSALSFAASRGCTTIVGMLLDDGAKIDIMNAHGSTPLSDACSAGRTETVNLLLARGANAFVSMKQGNTVLFASIDNGAVGPQETRLEIVKILVDHGVNVNQKTNDGSTPLHVAAMNEDHPLVEYLLSKGADTDAVDNNNMSPLDLTEEGNNSVIADILRIEGTRRMQCHAFAMGQIERLGAGSRVRFLDPGVARMILECV